MKRKLRQVEDLLKNEGFGLVITGQGFICKKCHNAFCVCPLTAEEKAKVAPKYTY